MKGLLELTFALILSVSFNPGKIFAQKANLQKLPSSLILKGNDSVAYRDPAAIFHNNRCYLYFTLVEIETDGKIFAYTAMTSSVDMIKWEPVRKLTTRNQHLNFSSPGNIIRYRNEWVMCLQTYPRPDYVASQMPRYGTGDARLFIMKSKDLQKWTEPVLVKVKGDMVDEKSMGRMIDPFLIRDRNTPGKWWMFYKQNGASRSFSNDLVHWTYSGHFPAGENACIIPLGNGYLLIHSPENNGIAFKESTDLVNWKNRSDTTYLGQQSWPWTKGRITAGFVLDTGKRQNRYLMFFHGSGPLTEQERDFDKNASIGIAWSNDTRQWFWR